MWVKNNRKSFQKGQFFRHLCHWQFSKRKQGSINKKLI